MLAAKPDYVVVIGAGGFDNTLTNQLLDIGVKPEQIIHPFGITTQVRNWGKRSVGSIYGTFFDSNLDDLTTEGKQFVEQFRAQNDRPPSYIENYCYVTAHIIREAIDKNPGAADDREKFRDAMSGLNTKETTSGIPDHVRQERSPQGIHVFHADPGRGRQGLQGKAGLLHRVGS